MDFKKYFSQITNFSELKFHMDKKHNSLIGVVVLHKNLYLDRKMIFILSIKNKLSENVQSYNVIYRVHFLSMRNFLTEMSLFQSVNKSNFDKKPCTILSTTSISEWVFYACEILILKISYFTVQNLKKNICSLSVLCSPQLILTKSPQISGQNKSENWSK